MNTTLEHPLLLIWIALISFIIILLVMISFIAICVIITRAAHTQTSSKYDAIIVLGAGLRGDKISRTLASRLDIAYQYYRTYPETILIVSGGLGKSDTTTEAFAMKKYLISKYGLPETSIILEDKSKRTLENFKLSKALLDDYFSFQYSVAYVTSDFHMYRSGKIAKLTGFNSDGFSAPTALHLLPKCYTREYFSIIKFYLIDYKTH